jgi:hypothetical protein
VDELPWAGAGWREKAEAWIGEQAEGLGLEPSGPVEEVKIRPWSAVLRAPTSDGLVYFKANLPALGNEPQLTRLLHRIDPEHVQPVLADEPEQLWMLQADGGPVMRERFGDGRELDRWERMLGLYADLQVRASAHTDDLLAAGAPDRRLGALRGLFERLIEAAAALTPEEEALSADELDHLRALGPRVGELAARLGAYGLPASIDHSDLHPGNVLAPGDGYVFFDWHEAAVTHPFFSMVVATRWLENVHKVMPGSAEGRLLDAAYLEPWAAYGTAAELLATLDLAVRLGTLQRALGWMRVVAGLPPAEQAQWGGYVHGWLRDVATEIDRS